MLCGRSPSSGESAKSPISADSRVVGTSAASGELGTALYTDTDGERRDDWYAPDPLDAVRPCPCPTGGESRGESGAGPPENVRACAEYVE